MTTVFALAPAKLNLGLEVVGKRPDGYHDIVSVMQTVSIFDRLTFKRSPRTTFDVSDPSLATDDNLVLVAAQRFEQTFNLVSGTTITLEKRIPAAAGLGGASSDAAATIAALAQLHSAGRIEVSSDSIAASVGSDVSFLLKGGTSLVEGRGEVSRQLRALSSPWFVVLVPSIIIPRKTASLYASLQPTDFSSGQRVRELAGLIDQDRALAPELLGNAFLRPLRTLRPELTTYERAFISAGATFVSLSGAGPALYTATGDHLTARTIAANLKHVVEPNSGVFVCRPVAHAPLLLVGHDAEGSGNGTDANAQTFER
jgi:4-diphosphocytidyl-2-C-methyl-D-erythritol kinase